MAEYFRSPQWFLNITVLVGVVGFVFNLMVCVVFLQRRMRESNARYYFLSLASGDLLYSLSAIFDGIPELLLQTRTSCKWYTLTDSCGYYAGLNSMILLAIERFCAIRYPTFFKTMIRKSNIRIQILSVWGISLLLSLHPLWQSEVISMQLPGNGTKVRSCEVIDESGVGIYHLIYSIIGAIVFFSFTFCTVHALRKRSTKAGSRISKPNRSKKKPWLRLIFLMSMFFICFGPVIVYYVFYEIDESMRDTRSSFLFRKALFLFTYIHTWLNPLMHWVCDTEFRQLSKGCFCRKCTKTKVRPIQRAEQVKPIKTNRSDSFETCINSRGTSVIPVDVSVHV